MNINHILLVSRTRAVGGMSQQELLRKREPFLAGGSLSFFSATASASDPWSLLAAFPAGAFAAL